MIVWILGEQNLEEEKRLAQAIAGAYEKGLWLHGETVRKEFKLPAGSTVEEMARNSLVLSYRLAVIAKILEEQGSLVVVGHDEKLKIITSLRRLLPECLVVLIDKSTEKGLREPFVAWEKSNKVNDRDLLVEEILRKLKGEGYGTA